METTTTPTTDKAPPAAYTPDMTPADIDATYKRLFAEAVEEHADGDKFKVPREVADELATGYRLAHTRYVRLRDGHERRPTKKGVRRTTTGTEVADDGTMTCDRCGLDLPAKKFPTITGKPGLRGTTCRTCKKENR